MFILSGNQIRQKRVIHRIKQKDLAKELSISDTQLCLIELEKSNSFELRYRASKYFEDLELKECSKNYSTERNQNEETKTNTDTDHD